MDVKVIPVLEDNYIFVINIEGQAIVVDPAQADPVIQYLESNNIPLHAILNTHHHGDHVGGNKQLVEKYRCHVWAYEPDAQRIPLASHLVNDGDQIEILGQCVKIIAVPGHTTGHIAYWFSEEDVLFCGDTLFSLGCGRLFEGSPQQMWESLLKLRSLPDHTQVYCTHEYTLNNGKFASAIDGENTNLKSYLQECRTKRKKNIPTVPTRIDTEKACNPFLRADNSLLQEHLGLKNDALEVFTFLRKKKDSF